MVVQDWRHLGQCIKRDRKRKQWLQADLAEAAGLTKRTIGTYENGHPPAVAPDIPAGYFAVGRALDWPADGVERALAGENPLGEQRVATEPAIEVSAALAPKVMQASPADLFPGVGRFARAAVAAGGDPKLRDLLEDVADRLLQSVPQAAPASQQSTFDLAAYRPQAWDEGDPGVPEDDAERIRHAIEEYNRGQRKS